MRNIITYKDETCACANAPCECTYDECECGDNCYCEDCEKSYTMVHPDDMESPSYAELIRSSGNTFIKLCARYSRDFEHIIQTDVYPALSAVWNGRTAIKPKQARVLLIANSYFRAMGSARNRKNMTYLISEMTHRGRYSDMMTDSIREDIKEAFDNQKLGGGLTVNIDHLILNYGNETFWEGVDPGDVELWEITLAPYWYGFAMGDFSEFKTNGDYTKLATAVNIILKYSV